ncbi:MAG: DeoR family transcriptional regulator [Bacillus sp. (in: Bacteria)]|nr:DeoR family transcriptional regulator [Bacillus sp. (in: firmicutes)]
MLPVDRRRTIVEILYNQGSVVVTELSEQFNVSEETIRRDLEKLEKERVLKRTYGGAYLDKGMMNDVPVWIREEAYREGKESIGQKCSEMIEKRKCHFSRLEHYLIVYCKKDKKYKAYHCYYKLIKGCYRVINR